MKFSEILGFHMTPNLITLVPKSVTRPVARVYWQVSDATATEAGLIATDVTSTLRLCHGEQRSPNRTRYHFPSLCVAAACLEKPVYIKHAQKTLWFYM